ncbi:secretion protein EccK [Mycolicibacterium smegmatis]|nr:secretion protein EccK [Mycolicibacterium smegmatis]
MSAARAERDAAQRAVRRSGVDPMENARRIAAALNAPGMADEDDFMFFWVTALTVDGKIVVANNYGLAYIPEQVRLPEQVHMASADESITPADRASWVNQPVVAVQRWAQHHDTELRAVIATEEQLQHTDAGVHHEVLRPEDIPANGKMVGRDRLQVIAPRVAAQLSRIPDTDLVKVLPPASADENPPEDRRLELWDEVWQPLTSRASNTGAVHLEAFLAYAVHAQEHAIHAAHTAADPEVQRRAVSDFIYWQHVGQLVADAVAA